MRRALPIALLVLVGGAFLLGGQARANIGIEFTLEAIVAWVASLGWTGPAIFVALVTFRQFLLLPSAIILPVGGLCFGALAGTLLGGAGIVISGIMKFSAARWLGRDWLRSQLGGRVETFEQRVSAAGPWVIGLSTAHPIGPMSPFHWAAGLSSIPVLGFLIAIVVGGPVRAAAYSFLGSTLLDFGSPRFYVASTVLVAVTVLPLLHPAVRRRLLAEARRGGRVSPAPTPKEQDDPRVG